LGAAESQGVQAAGQGKVVGSLGAPCDGEVRQEDVGSQIVDESEDLQPYFSRLIGDDVKAVVIPLQPELVLGLRTERVVPAELNVVVIIMSRAACRKACQRLHVRVFLEVMPVAVAQIELVVVAEAMVQPSGSKILARVVVKHAAVAFKLVHQRSEERRVGKECRSRWWLYH